MVRHHPPPNPPFSPSSLEFPTFRRLPLLNLTENSLKAKMKLRSDEKGAAGTRAVERAGQGEDPQVVGRRRDFDFVERNP